MDGDYGFRGFFALRTPQDLLAKLRHDHARLVDNPIDSYAAFDFFVTANHLVDWIWPSATRTQQRDNRRAETIPRIPDAPKTPPRYQRWGYRGLTRTGVALMKAIPQRAAYGV